MTTYGVRAEYDYSATHKREKLTVWSPPFFSVFEGVAYSLPKGDGYMVTTYNGDKVRVTCPTPRNDETWLRVDDAIQRALDAHYAATGVSSLSND